MVLCTWGRSRLSLYIIFLNLDIPSNIDKKSFWSPAQPHALFDIDLTLDIVDRYVSATLCISNTISLSGVPPCGSQQSLKMQKSACLWYSHTGARSFKYLPLNGVFVYVLPGEHAAPLTIPLLQQWARSKWELPSRLSGLRRHSKPCDTRFLLAILRRPFRQ